MKGPKVTAKKIAGIFILTAFLTLSAAGSPQGNRTVWQIADDPGLPRVLVIGDYISIDYVNAVRDLLNGRANVHHIRWSPTKVADGGSTEDGLKHLDFWLGDGKWELIHFNWGLHDIKHVDETGKKTAKDKGKKNTQPRKYEENLTELLRRLKATGAKLVWANTLPVPEGDWARVSGAEVMYNKIAEKVMADNGVYIEDQYSLIKPHSHHIQSPQDAYLSTEGKDFLAAQIAETIGALLLGSEPKVLSKPAGAFSDIFNNDKFQQRFILGGTKPTIPKNIPDGVEFQSRVVYGNVDGLELTADIFTPKKVPEKPRPAIVFLHGGAWLYGAAGAFHHQGSYLAEKYGFFAMDVNYRTMHIARFPGGLQDAKCAVRYIRSRAKELNIDPNKIAISGGSAGAHLSSMVATTAGAAEYEGNGGHQQFASNVNLAVLFNGEFDIWDLIEKTDFRKTTALFAGGTPDEIPEIYDEMSSINRAAKDTPPMLFLHGTADTCVGYQQSIDFSNNLKALGIHSEVEIYPGQPHSWYNYEENREITLKRMEKFLVEQFDL